MGTLLARMWARSLYQSEADFLQRYFGESLPMGRLRVARSFHPRRSWSPQGTRISLARGCFPGGDPRQPIHIEVPEVAATLAHEALHVWQRVQGRWVTLQGARLQIPYTLIGRNPYLYELAADPGVMLERFQRANIEQQGQMFEDYVRLAQTGADTEPYRALAEWVRAPRGMV